MRLQIEPPDRKWQYLLFAAEPYETIAFKVTDQDQLLSVWGPR
jgi:splicing factor 3A subunit 2